MVTITLKFTTTYGAEKELEVYQEGILYIAKDGSYWKVITKNGDAVKTGIHTLGKCREFCNAIMPYAITAIGDDGKLDKRYPLNQEMLKQAIQVESYKINYS